MHWERSLTASRGIRVPQCAGAVDRTHIPVVSPIKKCPANYYNHKGCHSIILQSSVNNKGRFIDGWPAEWPERKDKQCWRSAGYAWRPSVHSAVMVMKEVSDNGHLTQLEKRFITIGWVRHELWYVEHTYGRVKGRWRCLLKRLDVSTDSVPGLVGACCVLHNLCEIDDDGFENGWKALVLMKAHTSNISTAQLEASAVLIRKAFVEYFANHLNIPRTLTTECHHTTCNLYCVWCNDVAVDCLPSSLTVANIGCTHWR